MVDFKITCYQRPAQRIYTLGSYNPTSISYGRAEPTIVKFGCGLQFTVADDAWWYLPGHREYDVNMYQGQEVAIHDIDVYDPNRPYTIEEILEISPEYIQDTIIFNLDIFGKVN
jgi:hypothetical protein